MSGIDVLPDINALPDFYVQCEYNNADKLIGLYSVSKLTWEGYHDKRYYSIVEQNGKTFLFLGSGKQRTGYTRALFQKKVLISDSALIIHDTLIYKTTKQNQISVQFYTNINSDSILFKEMTFSFTDKKDMKDTPLSSFTFYKDWFNLSENAFHIVGGIINLKSDTILIWTTIKKRDYPDSYINITKNDLKDRPTMPITLFWLKDSGFLY